MIVNASPTGFCPRMTVDPTVNTSAAIDTGSASTTIANPHRSAGMTNSLVVWCLLLALWLCYRPYGNRRNPYRRRIPSAPNTNTTS